MKHDLEIGEESLTEKKQRSSAPAFPEESSTVTEPLIVAGDAPPVAEWPPVWKPIEESPQTKHGMLLSYQFLREALEKGDDSMSIDPSNKIKIKAFIKKVVASRGYDLDDHPSELRSELRHSVLFPVPLGIVFRFRPQSQKIKEVVDFVVSSINAEAEVQKHDERYEFHQLEKVVEARLCPSWYFLVTFSVREAVPNPDCLKTVQAMVHNPLYSTYHLEEWRFKPDEEARPFTPPDEAKMFKPLDWYKPRKVFTPDNKAMAGCDLPPAVITRIISFFPVEKMSDFKLVCKAWHKLMTKEFYGTCCALNMARANKKLGE